MFLYDTFSERLFLVKTMECEKNWIYQQYEKVHSYFLDSYFFFFITEKQTHQKHRSRKRRWNNRCVRETLGIFNTSNASPVRWR